LALKADSWQTAAGVVGQFTVLLRFLLFGAVSIVFLVALVIIGNALVIAKLERVREIGTLRAIGAQRSFILGMLTTESATIGGVFGGLGALCGACLVWTLGRVGIPAANDVFTFVFAGPRLVPRLSAAGLLGALVSVLCVSVLAGIYPAWLAMRVSPREAMQGEE
jgi:ABC-type lipoprotein release transport system permease subunit